MQLVNKAGEKIKEMMEIQVKSNVNISFKNTLLVTSLPSEIMFHQE